MVRAWRWLFGHVSTFGHLCSCGAQAYVRVRDRMDESACIECRCGKLWSFVWKLDHWDVKCWVPENQVTSPLINVHTEDAAADFKRRRDAGEFGARNEDEYQEMIREMAKSFDEDNSDVLDPHELG